MASKSDPRPYRRLSQEEFLRRVVESGTKCIPLDPYVRMFDNIRWQCGDYENHIWMATPANVLNGTGRPYCAGNKVFRGFNDLWTTHPHIAMQLVDKDVGYRISYSSHSKQNFICPRCGSLIENARVWDNIRYNFICPCCSDGVSYPERFVSNMLRQLKVHYKHDGTTNWSGLKRYDFYIKDLSLIIETHGEQHYDADKQFYGTIEKQRANDEYKKSLALSNGIKHYIVLDCRESDADFIKSSILDSKLVELFDLSSVDWQKCASDSCKSNIVMACDLWNNGTRSAKEISEIMCLTRTTVINYLNKGTKYGICDYDGKEQMRLSMAKNAKYNKKKIAV